MIKKKFLFKNISKFKMKTMMLKKIIIIIMDFNIIKSNHHLILMNIKMESLKKIITNILFNKIKIANK